MIGREIKAARIVRDIRSGMTPSQLMSKYRISQQGLHDALTKLVTHKLLQKRELSDKPSLYRDSEVLHQIRRLPRTQVRFPLQVWDFGQPYSNALIRDISEKGLCTVGISSLPDKSLLLQLRSGQFDDWNTFGFQATCRWISTRDELLAGFEITMISEEGLGQLRSLIRTLE
ncbi:MAG: PilZ domain-containing protein [Desulfomonile tiedjei]|uniref:PilZ domain-containing protein n=1 Tax=Desulfomonile tiedjei TaxID=2358 RepID=A0A9D6Z3Y8_9BACT|nr:PilZ domain-containing protein [Desulfomonile tiedjei]